MRFRNFLIPADGSPVTTLSPPTGTTLDPCRDSPSTNCNYLNETLLICSKPDAPPTAMYCPRFCGLCTPACADEPDVDCRKQNDTQNICALGTYAATHLCRKFCGYCAGITTEYRHEAWYMFKNHFLRKNKGNGN